METQETSAIFPAMVAIMKDVEAIKKEKTNTQGAGFKYRGIDDVMNSLHEAFAKNGVFITTEVIDRKEVERQSKSGGALFYVTITVRFTFNASDGSFISSTIYGTAMDSGDKADNKCMSIALKYCLLQAFLIPTEDMAEPDSQTHEVKAKTQPEPQKEQNGTESKDPKAYPPDERPWMTEAQFKKIISRIESGEADAGTKAIALMKMKKEYKAAILNAKPVLAIDPEINQDLPY